jgi:hypothetical protein
LLNSRDHSFSSPGPIVSFESCSFPESASDPQRRGSNDEKAEAAEVEVVVVVVAGAAVVPEGAAKEAEVVLAASHLSAHPLEA